MLDACHCRTHSSCVFVCVTSECQHIEYLFCELVHVNNLPMQDSFVQCVSFLSKCQRTEHQIYL